MSRTWTDVNSDLETFFEPVTGQYPINYRILGWNRAQQVFVSHTPRFRVTDLTIDTDERSAILPDDFYAMYGILDEAEDLWWTELNPTPGHETRRHTAEIREYRKWGNRLYLGRDTSYQEGQELSLYYYAYYPSIEWNGDVESPDYSQDQIYIPEWAQLAVTHLCAAICFQPSSNEAADLNQWKMDIEAGTPLMNPRALQAREHRLWYDDIIGRFAAVKHR